MSVTRSFRCFSLLCILLVPGFAIAQSTASYCEAPPAVQEELSKISKLYDEDLPFVVIRERQIAMAEELLKKYPDNFHVRRRYQDVRQGGFIVNRYALIDEYRAHMEKNPNDPVAVYLYARLLVGQKTKEAIELATKLTQQAPDFPWTHLQLAEIYNYPNFKDPAKLKEHLKIWSSKCPTLLSAVNLITRAGDKEMMTSTAQSLRVHLESSTKPDDFYYWDNLWTLGFKLRTVPEHAQWRQQIAEDLKKLRARNLNTKEWLQALQAGYKQVGDKTNQRLVEDELLRLVPKSGSARHIVESRYLEEHPFPKAEEPDEKKQAYFHEYVKVIREWLKQWPNDVLLWSNLVRTLTQIEGSSPAEVEAAYKEYAVANERSYNSYSLPPIEVTVARYYLKRGANLESVPVLIEKGVAHIERVENTRGPSDLFPARDSEESNLKYVRTESWPSLAEAYARLKQPEKAREVLVKIFQLSSSNKQLNDTQKRAYAYDQTVYWRTVGKVAEVEQRKLDALMAYQTALTFRLAAPTTGPGKKDELSESAQRLWKELGGTDQGWNAYLARNVVDKSKVGSAEVATWDSKNITLPEFELSDLQGRKWSTADLKGKVAFINFWATWCGPCRQELPYVQKLRERLKDRKDVLVITLNIDDEVGMVEPFMKDNKYNFPTLLAQTFAEQQGVTSIPRNWVVSSDGKVMFEGIGFDNDGEGFLKKALDVIEKVKGTNAQP
ncbi:MAG TPA: redoxin family protein [Pyrinomonadaceae bacterium]|nr:redoxin family protein [Pyrinomonadaceae bacterium]